VKLLSRRARFIWLFLASLILSLVLSHAETWRPASKAQAQTATAQPLVLTVENTAFASFQDANGTTQPVTSNPTQFTATVEQAGLEIIKTGDRSAAEPGDAVVYRLLIRNTGTVPVANLAVTDELPLGLRYVENSVRGSVGTGASAVPLALPEPTITGRTLTFPIGQTIAPNQTVNLAYAALLTPDAVRGSGRNSAIALGDVGGRPIRSNIASHRILIRPGIVSDCGTIVGRVFVDKNFDGQQQPGEPGVPNAIVFMDDGNRVVTDADGLFSLANVISGNRSGTLDLTSLPGYTLAPNLYWIEGNSQSRLVRLQPGGLARMNFAVTPAFGEGQQ
jgi:uncharacterized repeat protein (TIGR01451 family)